VLECQRHRLEDAATAFRQQRIALFKALRDVGERELRHRFLGQEPRDLKCCHRNGDRKWHYTPKHGSWLDLAESELGVLTSQCLDRRIPDKQS
jgi:hypothetical protein